MNRYLIHQMAQRRQGDLLRAAEEPLRAGRTARPIVLRRIIVPIPRVAAQIGRRRTGVAAPPTSGR